MPARYGGALALLLAMSLAAAQEIEQIHSIQTGATYAKATVVPKLSLAVSRFMQRPFDMVLEFTGAAKFVGALDLADRQQMSRVMYTQTLATGCGGDSPIDMVYLGLESGIFLGYFSPTSYTYRPPSGSMAEQLPWDPYTLENINGVCDQTPGACDFSSNVAAAKACLGDDAACGAADISGGVVTDPWERLDAGRANCATAGVDCRFSAYGNRSWDGKIVSSSCARAGVDVSDGVDVSNCTAVSIAGGDADADLQACEAIAGCAYTPTNVSSGTEEACTAVCTDRCCDGDLRAYYNTDSYGEPIEMTRWRVYDHRARGWYTQQKERFLRFHEMFGWSNVYTFASTGALGISATAAIYDGAMFHGVAAIDYTLDEVSQLIRHELDAVRTDPGITWGYIVEVSGTTLGALIGSTVEPVSRQFSNGSVTRLQAVHSAHPGTKVSAQYLEIEGWPAVDGAVLSQGDTLVEIGTVRFEDRGLVWLIVAGQYKNCSSTDVWNNGQCQTCEGGTAPKDDECAPCESGRAGIGGVCLPCPDGTQPNTLGTACDRCPRGMAGKGGECVECNRFRGEVVNYEHTECVCPSGTYDSYLEQMPRLGDGLLDVERGHCEDAFGHISQATNKFDCDALSPPGVWVPVHHVYCWERGRQDDPHLDELNRPSFTDLAIDASNQRCITCPLCLTCDTGLISIKEGFNIATDLHYGNHSRCGESCSPVNTMNVYKCAHDGCPGFENNDTFASLACLENHDGLLCGACAPEYYVSSGICKHCGEAWRATTAKIKKLASDTPPHPRALAIDLQLRFYRRVVEKSWPRFNQGWKILAGNFQISASIASNTHIEWPDTIARFFDLVGSIANLNVMHVPGFACVVAESYFTHWSAQMLILPGILGACVIVYKVNKKARVEARDAALERIKQENKGTELQPLQKVAERLDLAVELGQIKTSVSSWAFMSVYLLYPGACQAIFSIFKCRKLDHEAKYLIADTRVACLKPDGSYDETYLVFLVFAIVGMVLYAFGIPFVLGLKLYRHRVTIRQNPEFVTLAAFKPLFQFYKPQCYMWEIYFMIQKVVLVGLMGIFEPSMAQKEVQVIISIVLICALCRTMPSKTQQFNYANIVSQATIILNFLAAVLLSQRTNMGISRDTIEVIVAIGMQIMMLYLVFVIFAKVKEMVKKSSEEVQVENRAKKLASVGSGSEEAWTPNCCCCCPRSDQQDDESTEGNDSKSATPGDEKSMDDKTKDDEAIRLVFNFFDADGGGSVNMFEIERVLRMFDLKISIEDRDAALTMAERSLMKGYDKKLEQLEEGFDKLSSDMHTTEDKLTSIKLIQDAIFPFFTTETTRESETETEREPAEESETRKLDLPPFEWNEWAHWKRSQGYDHAKVFIEEMLAASKHDDNQTNYDRIKQISWREMKNYCIQRVRVRKEATTLSKAQSQVESIAHDDDSRGYVLDVIKEDTEFLGSLYLPKELKDLRDLGTSTETESHKKAIESLLQACLDAHRPAEATRSLLVRSRMKELKQLKLLSLKELQAKADELCIARKWISERTEETKETEEEALIVEIERQTMEMPFDTFKAIWTSGEDSLQYLRKSIVKRKSFRSAGAIISSIRRLGSRDDGAQNGGADRRGTSTVINPIVADEE